MMKLNQSLDQDLAARPVRQGGLGGGGAAPQMSPPYIIERRGPRGKPFQNGCKWTIW